MERPQEDVFAVVSEASLLEQTRAFGQMFEKGS
jgi:hypothetical protein